MMGSVLSLFLPSYPTVLVYMLQNTEYQPGAYLAWYWRTTDFTTVMRRRTLLRTRPALLLLWAARIGMFVQLLAGVACIGIWFTRHTPGTWQFGLSLLLSYPVVWAHLLVLPVWLGRIFVVGPYERRLIKLSRQTFAKHPATKIAVAGSYGKTSMKELLGTVLAAAKTVAVTPANKNVAASHARFAASLTGKEDVLVIEYGEGKPGDVQHFAAVTQPNIGIITGLAPAHLDQYPSFEAAARDIFSLADYLQDKQVYVNNESEAVRPYLKPTHLSYNSTGVDGWTVHDVKVDYDGVAFTLKRSKQRLRIQSGLLGRHQIGPLAAVAAIADQLGLTKSQIEAGCKATQPFEHRMQPRAVGGAWIIDDTYNGNIDGIKAGLALLKELPAKRKMYVTPGLVDQGEETIPVHFRMGQLIAEAAPDKVVLMENSVTSHIQAGLKEGGYRGELELQTDPLGFYTGLEHFVAAGDLWLLQNDWPDNYA